VLKIADVPLAPALPVNCGAENRIANDERHQSQIENLEIDQKTSNRQSNHRLPIIP
jgi:hypothetical protein